MSLNWKITKEDFSFVEKIVQRAIREGWITPSQRPTLLMDIVATHCNGCPLMLGWMVEAKDYELGHDLYGINSTINRRTGQLEGAFVPRFAKVNHVS